MSTLLSVADRLSRMSAVSGLVDKIADRIAPHASAKACGGGCTVYYGGCYNHQRQVVYGNSCGQYCCNPTCTVYYAC